MEKVSIIIPVFNAEQYIGKCLTSVRNQTYENIEVICVDDCSTDGSLKIIKEYMERDRRIQCIALSKNAGSYVARQRGAEMASGDYVLFVDADDYIDPGLIDELINFAENRDFDIIHFSSEVEDCGVGEQRTEEMRKFVMPLQEELFGADIFTRCFCDGDYGFNLWNKFLKANMCRKVYSILEDCNLCSRAEDAFLYFFMASEAESYIGLVTRQRYHYCFGNGSTCRRGLSSKDFESYCSYVRLLEQIQLFSKNTKIFSQRVIFQKAVAILKDRLLKETTETWILNVKEAEKTKALGVFAESWGFVDMADMICKAFPTYKNDFANHILDGQLLPKNNRASEKVAFYYRKYGQGGVERVISLLIPLFLEAGYEVVLITETEKEDNDFALPKQVKRYTIPADTEIASGRIRYRERADSLIDIYKKEHIDTICYQESIGRYLLYDLIVTKASGVKFVLSKHELFSQEIVLHRDTLTDNLAEYPLLDALTVLSSDEKMFWESLGVPGMLIPNPLTVRKHNHFQYNADSHDIVWIGRLDRNQKRYQDIVPIMREVVKDIPDAVIRIYGSPEPYNNDVHLLETQISEAHLDKNIRYMGYSNQIDDMFADVGVMLVTSAYESSPMVITEAKQFGIPIVLYSMPYIETLKNGKGFLAVNQGDTLAAAEAIVHILADVGYRTQLSRESADSLYYSDDDVISRWRHLLTGNPCCETTSDNIYGNIIRTMIFHMSLGNSNYRELKRKHEKLLEENKLLQVMHIMDDRRLKIALYPYGGLGKKIFQTLHSAQIEVSLIVDNMLCDKEDDVLSVNNLKKIDVHDYLFIVTSNNVKIYREIRDEIRGIVPEENIYDWYPLDEEQYMSKWKW